MNTVISTPCGEIKGSASDGVIAFKGIRYATAERWAYPVITEKWNGVYDATSYGNCSYQPRAFYNEEENPGKIFYYNEFRKGETVDARIILRTSGTMNGSTQTKNALLRFPPP